MKAKRWIGMLLCLAVTACAAGCGYTGEAGSQGTVAAAHETMGQGAALPERAQEDSAEDNPGLAQPQRVDIDLTAMSGTMAYSQVFSMVNDPVGYIGRTVRMEGTFASYRDPSTGTDYFACVIQDATGCCAEAIEFLPAEGEDLPTEGERITVTGVFDTYRENGSLYCTLRNARLEDGAQTTD